MSADERWGCFWFGFAATLIVGCGFHSPSLKVALYLDPVDAGGGCLSVIPGNHHLAYPQALRAATEARPLDLTDPDWAGGVALPSQPGDVVVFHRAAWGGQINRCGQPSAVPLQAQAVAYFAPSRPAAELRGAAFARHVDRA